jgi:hypothetical protein
MYKVLELLVATYKDYQLVYKSDPAKQTDLTFKARLSKVQSLLVNQVEIINLINKEGVTYKVMKPLTRSLLLIGQQQGLAASKTLKSKLMKHVAFLSSFSVNLSDTLRPRL